MKRATLTPNRFIISTRSWLVKGLALFLILLALGSCEDDIGLIGTNSRTSRFGVYFKEFEIPVTTVQADSIVSEASQSGRIICGKAYSPNFDSYFGNVTAKAFLQFTPRTSFTSAPKIDITDKSNFIETSLTVYFVLDYYVYGDTLDGALDFSLHRIMNGSNFFYDREFYTKSTLDYETDVLATTTFNYKKDSIDDHRIRNSDSNNANNRYDTLKFSIPIDVTDFADNLLDSATAKGVYYTNSESKWVLNYTKTDSVFRRAFPGLVLVAGNNNNRVMGFQAVSAQMTLNYSYVKDGNPVNASYSYSLSAPSFSNIEYDRAGTALAALNYDNKYQDFSAPDDFCYIQSGTGAFAKLDFSAVHSYFDANPDTIKYMALNAAELLVDAEPVTARKHLNAPEFLYFRAIKNNNRFIENTYTASMGLYDTELAGVYYCLANRRYLDALGDNVTTSATVLAAKKNTTTGRIIYSTYLTNFFQNFLDGQEGYSKLNTMAIIPADGNYGVSLHGLSFNKQKVKLRIYYTKTL